MLERSTQVSMMHKEMSSWLKAVQSLGFRKMNIAKRLPKQPKVIRQEEETPGIQYFHFTSSCKVMD